jgi:Outer membrane receptor proteins, mostly Fe transport
MKLIRPQWEASLIYLYSIALFLGLSLFSPQQLYAQKGKNATGTVVDSQGEPIIGVNVSVKGDKSMGTVTDINGHFVLKINDKSIVVFSFIGFRNKEVPAASLINATVKLEENTQTLQEVVVVGYGSQKKETMTGAISQIKGSDMLKSPVANMGQALTGRAAGVTTYQQSGEPGADDVTIRIRGTGTLNSASPLVLVDGVEREFSQIDPSEIESMSVLKDAASTAVFGIRGANGVIIITTKKGVEGPAKVSFSANFAMQQPIRMPNSADAVTIAKMYNEAKYNDDPTQNPSFSADDIALYANGKDPLGHPNINWKEYMMKPASFQQKYNLNVSGGTKNTKYYTSIAFFGQGGLMKDFSNKVEKLAYSTNYDYKRVNIRSNVDVSLTPTTTIGIQLGGIIANKVSPPDVFGSIIQAAPLGGPFIYEHKLVALPNIPWGGSPLATLFTSQDDMTSNTINTNISFNQKLDFLTKGLLLRGLGSYDSFYSHTLIKTQPQNYYRLQNGYDADGNSVNVLEQAWEAGVIPTPTESWSRSQQMHAELALEYKRSFGDHNIGGLILGTLDKKWWMYNGSSSITQYVTVPVSYEGVVGRATYDYKMRYLAEFNVGYNGSENFAKGKRFAWFPAVSLGWNLAEENFMKGIVSSDILSKLKLRASYGLTGNDNTAGRRFMYLSGEYTSGGGSMFGSSTQTSLGGFIEGKQGNENVTWETAEKQNYGIDLGLFKNRLAVTFEYFFDDRKDILATRATEPGHLAISGQDVYNIGRVKNHGYEIDAKWNDQIGKFSYYVASNYSFARNKIVEDGSIKDPANPQLWTTGHAVGTKWGFLFNGFYNTTDELKQGPVYGNPSIGDARFTDVNGDGKITTDDQVPLGYPEIPEVNYGFSFGGSYKGFDFSCMFQGAANSTKYLTGIFRSPFATNGGMPSFIVDERWTPENAENAKRPKLTLAYTSNSYVESSLWKRDGAYLKLRNVEIAYTISAKKMQELLKVPSMGSMRIFLNGQNLYCWDKLKFVDPEAKTGGFEYPQLRIYNLGFQVNF